MAPLMLSGLILLGIPMLLLIVFKTNAAIMFLSACAGIVLLDSLDPAVVATAGALVPGDGEAYTRLAVVFLTMTFSAVVFRGSIHKMSGYLLHGILVILSALMLWAALPAVTGVSWLIDGTETSVWKSVDDFKTVIIALGLALSLVVILKLKRKK